MKYTITLADGTQLTDLEMNGSNYVSIERVDESIFENNLSTMTVSDGENVETYRDMVFVQQMPWGDGTFYLAFREKTQQEKLEERLQAFENGYTALLIANCTYFDGIKYVFDRDKPLDVVLPMPVVPNAFYRYEGKLYVGLQNGTATLETFNDFFAED